MEKEPSVSDHVISHLIFALDDCYYDGGCEVAGRSNGLNLLLKTMNHLDLGGDGSDEAICPIAHVRFDEASVDGFPEGSCFVEGKPQYCIAELPCKHALHALSALYHMALNGMRCPVCRKGIPGTMHPKCIPAHLRNEVIGRVKASIDDRMREVLDQDRATALSFAAAAAAATSSAMRTLRRADAASAAGMDGEGGRRATTTFVYTTSARGAEGLGSGSRAIPGTDPVQRAIDIEARRWDDYFTDVQMEILDGTVLHGRGAGGVRLDGGPYNLLIQVLLRSLDENDIPRPSDPPRAETPPPVAAEDEEGRATPATSVYSSHSSSSSPLPPLVLVPDDDEDDDGSGSGRSSLSLEQDPMDERSGTDGTGNGIDLRGASHGTLDIGDSGIDLRDASHVTLTMYLYRTIGPDVMGYEIHSAEFSASRRQRRDGTSDGGTPPVMFALDSTQIHSLENRIRCVDPKYIRFVVHTRDSEDRVVQVLNTQMMETRLFRGASRQERISSSQGESGGTIVLSFESDVSLPGPSPTWLAFSALQQLEILLPVVC